MPKFRKRPVVIEAVEWRPGVKIEGVYDDPAQLVGVPGATLGHQLCIREGAAIIVTLEGLMTVSPGDMVITGVHGEKYPCKPDIFEETYEPVDE